MAADAYLKEASAQLQRAATQLDMDVAKIQHELDAKRLALRGEIQKIEADAKLKQTELMIANDNILRTRLVAELADEKRMATDKKQELGGSEQTLRDIIAAKRKMVTDLQARANELMRLAADPLLK